MGSTDDEIRRKHEKPLVDKATALRVLKKYYNMSDVAALFDLESYDDRNFKVELKTGQVYTLKFHNGVDSDNASSIEAQDQVLQFLISKGITCPAPYPTIEGSYIANVHVPLSGTPGQTRSIATRLLGWVHGTPMNTAVIAGGTSASTTKDLIERAGAFFGTLSTSLDEFDHPGAHRVHQWDLARMDEVERYIDAVADREQRELVLDVVEEFKRIKPVLSTLRRGVLQADFNDANIIVNVARDRTCTSTSTTSVAGVIDFGDMVYSARINDVAIAIAYMMLTAFGREHPMEAACAFLSGFCRHYALVAQELDVLYTLICGRLAASVTIGAYSYMQQPENTYLLLHAKPAQDMLRFLRRRFGSDVENITRQFKAAAASVSLLVPS